MSARGDNPLDGMVIAASSDRRAWLSTTMGQIAHARITAIAAISLDRIFQSAPDLIVVDADNQALSSAIIRVGEALPGGTGLIALADNPEPRWVSSALQAGVNAILLREVTAEELRLAILAAEAGLVLLHPSSARSLRNRNLTADHDSSPLLEALTVREQEVLRLVSDGLGNKEIAGRLKISEHTVKFHISSILGKLGAASRTEAVSQGIRKGFLVI